MRNVNGVTETWIVLALAVLLLASPWVFQFEAGLVTVNAVISALIVGGTALIALATRGRWGGWDSFVFLNLVFGAYVLVSPLLFHFSDIAAIWVDITVGFAVSALATLNVWRLTATRPALS